MVRKHLNLLSLRAVELGCSYKKTEKMLYFPMDGYVVNGDVVI
jgi:hypothetical protein